MSAATAFPARFVRGLVALGMTAALPAASEVFVSVNGDDASAGSRDKPWRTVAHAASLARPGDTVTVLPGDYRDQVPEIQASGRPDALLTIRSAQPGEARIGGAILRGDYLAWEGFAIDGDNNANRGRGIYAGMANDPKHPAQTGCVIAGNVLTNLSGTAITSGIQAVVRDNVMKRVHRGLFVNSGTLVENNEIDTLIAPMVDKPPDGDIPAMQAPKKTSYAFFAGDDITFRGNFWHGTYDGRDGAPPLNLFYRWGTDFFTTWDGSGVGSSNRILIENNRCFYATHAIEPLARGLRNSKGITVRNNLLVNTCYVGILPQMWQDVVVENNTLINCGAYPVWARSEIQSRGMIVRNNLIAAWKHEKLAANGFRPPESGIRIDNDAWIPAVRIENNLYHGYRNREYSTTDFTAEPRFVDPERGDFRLAPGSPGTGTGASLPAPRTPAHTQLD